MTDNSAFGSLIDVLFNTISTRITILFASAFGLVLFRHTGGQDIDRLGKILPEKWRKERKLYSPVVVEKLCRRLPAGVWKS